MMQSELARRPTSERREPPPDPVTYVWRCTSQRLTAPTKRAFEDLWRETEGGRKEASVTAAWLAYQQGTSGDAGRKRLEQLEELGFIRKREGQKKGAYWVTMLDPFAALRVLAPADQNLHFDFDRLDERDTFAPAGEDAAGGLRVVRHDSPLPRSPQEALPTVPPDAPAGPGQGRLRGSPTILGEVPPEDPPEEARQDAALPRPDAISLNLSEETRKYTSHFSNFTSPEKCSIAKDLPAAEPRRGTSGGSSADDEAEFHRQLAQRRAELVREGVDSTSLGAVMVAKVEAAISPSAREARVHELVGVMRKRIRDPKMMRGPLLRLAWAIIDGYVQERLMYAALDQLDEMDAGRKLTSPRSSYFNGCIKRLLRGVPDDRGPRVAPKPR